MAYPPPNNPSASQMGYSSPSNQPTGLPPNYNFTFPYGSNLNPPTFSTSAGLSNALAPGAQTMASATAGPAGATLHGPACENALTAPSSIAIPQLPMQLPPNYTLNRNGKRNASNVELDQGPSPNPRRQKTDALNLPTTPASQAGYYGSIDTGLGGVSFTNANHGRPFNSQVYNSTPQGSRTPIPMVGQQAQNLPPSYPFHSGSTALQWQLGQGTAGATPSAEGIRTIYGSYTTTNLQQTRPSMYFSPDGTLPMGRQTPKTVTQQPMPSVNLVNRNDYGQALPQDQISAMHPQAVYNGVGTPAYVEGISRPASASQILARSQGQQPGQATPRSMTPAINHNGSNHRRPMWAPVHPQAAVSQVGAPGQGRSLSREAFAASPNTQCLAGSQVRHQGQANYRPASAPMALQQMPDHGPAHSQVARPQARMPTCRSSSRQAFTAPAVARYQAQEQGQAAIQQPTLSSNVPEGATLRLSDHARQAPPVLSPQMALALLVGSMDLKQFASFKQLIGSASALSVEVYKAHIVAFFRALEGQTTSAIPPDVFRASSLALSCLQQQGLATTTGSVPIQNTNESTSALSMLISQQPVQGTPTGIPGVPASHFPSSQATGPTSANGKAPEGPTAGRPKQSLPFIAQALAPPQRHPSVARQPNPAVAHSRKAATLAEEQNNIPLPPSLQNSKPPTPSMAEENSIMAMIRAVHVLDGHSDEEIISLVGNYLVRKEHEERV